MGLNRNEIRDLKRVIENYHILQINNFVGYDYLYDEEQDIVDEIMGSSYNPDEHTPYIEQYYKLGMLRSSNSEDAINDVDWRVMERFLSSEGRIIPLTTHEIDVLNSIKSSTYSHIKNLSDKASHSMDLILIEQDRQARGNMTADRLRVELTREFAARKNISDITRNLAEKANSYQTDWERIARTELARSETQGALAGIRREHGDDPKVYVHVNDGACTKCVRAYLTSGAGSRPKVFSLKELEANGSNSGRKLSEYLPVVPPQHPNCYCSIRHFDADYVWSDEEKKFNFPKEYKRKIHRRSRVKITIGNKNFEV